MLVSLPRRLSVAWWGDRFVAGRSSDPCKILREDLISALTRLRDGDFSVRMSTRSRDPRDREIAKLFNEAVGFTDSISKEFARLAKVVGAGLPATVP